MTVQNSKNEACYELQSSTFVLIEASAFIRRLSEKVMLFSLDANL